MTPITARIAMIDSAEQIIAERGLPALTLKDVQIAADQSNKSAAKYHFGSREGLIEALIAARMGPINARRTELIEEIERSSDPTLVRQAVEALVHPLAAETLGRPGSRYARFLVQAVIDPVLAEVTQKHLQAESYRRVHQILVELCPAPGKIATWRTNNAVMFSMTALATREGTERTDAETTAIVSNLVDTLAAMIEAPVSIPTPYL
ncbi:MULTISPECIES: TetR/AcrR family transcriptional regulator [unclassified Rhodococcus (in: high G+C Gram-positive bacteria)]|uniref:TetR/AcrR family transcriptional regulator n=1 Tax=unclassified Rhodococcus (in: high G+C Gram-positive bacteria) TaxID=192944 RepID=UPI001FF90BB3|nr:MULTISPECIES: TetR/AcrR family transcriptional regulator [unclassified Rhodococcus (in: high G+C Gram-positive bacteria)]